MAKYFFKIVLFVGISSFFISCNDSEGEGGTGTLQGRVYKVMHTADNYDMSLDTIVAAKQDVFIVYGSDSYFGDDIETGEDGTYRFKYLTPGKYTVYAYSELASGERIAVKQTVTLKRGETLTLPDIYVHDGKAYGTSMIRGQVWATYFDKEGNTIATDWAYDHRVYIQKLGEDFYFDDTRVGINGLYFFQKLQPDTYVIFTFSQTNNEIPYPLFDTVEVTKTDTVFSAKLLSVRIKA